MNSIKRNLCIVVLLLGISMQGVAQKSLNPKAIIEAFDSTVYRYDGNWEQLDQLADEICKKTNNNPEVLTGMANSFFRHWAISNPAHKDLGFKYINKVIEKHPKYAPAYLIVGNTYMSDQFPDSINAHGYGLAVDKDSALLWFQQAINAMPQSPVGYEEYALALAYYMTGLEREKRSEIPVVTKLQEYGNLNPSYSVDLKAARIFVQLKSWDQAVECYKKINFETLSESDINEYILCLSDLKRAEISAAGSERFPTNYFFCHEAFSSYRTYAYDLSQKMRKKEIEIDSLQVAELYEKSLSFWERMLSLKPLNSCTSSDYVDAGWAYEGLGDYGNYTQSNRYGMYAKAAELFQSCSEVDTFSIDARSQALQSLSNVEFKMRNWDGAVNARNQIIELQKDNPSPAQYYLSYANMYSNMYSLIDDTDSAYACFAKADSLLAYIMEHLTYEEYRERIYKDRIEYNGYLVSRYFNKEFANTNRGEEFLTEYGKQYAENLLGLEQILGDEMFEYINQITTAYRYLANYCNEKGNYRQAKNYFNRILYYIPTDERTLKTLNGLKKY